MKLKSRPESGLLKGKFTATSIGLAKRLYQLMLDVAFLNADLNQARLFWEYFKAFDWGDNMQKYAFERMVNVYPEKHESPAKPVHSHLSIIEPISLDSVYRI